MINKFYNKLYKNISTSNDIFYRYYEDTYTYKDLFSNLLKLNSYLFKFKNKKIVLFGKKEFEVYSAIYAILLSNNTWIPVAEGIPHNRLIEMLNVIDADIIIHLDDLPGQVSNYAVEKDIKVWKLKDLLNGGKAHEFKNLDFNPNETAYIMFTSGSTGTPKGVPMTHNNYINFVDNVLEILPFTKGEVFSDFHDFAFDISIFYIFCAPMCEAAISPIKNNEDRIFPLNHILKNDITVWSSVPSAISRVQKFKPNDIINSKIRIMFLCGEPFSLDVLRYCLNNFKVTESYNFYGLTETGVENFYHRCEEKDLLEYEEMGHVPIGKPLKGNDVNVSEEKELLISGCQVTDGYLGFVGKERFEEIDGVTWYHSGDIVEIYKGVYFCKGRMDSQVKISGYRIELMDIEVNVKRYPNVKEAVCIVDDRKSSKIIVCFIETRDGGSIDLNNLKQHLKTRLPGYMVPKKIFLIDELPKNSNGKVSRKDVLNNYLMPTVK